MTYYSVKQTLNRKADIVALAKRYNVSVIPGKVMDNDEQDEQANNRFPVRVEAQKDMDWEALLDKVGQSANPVVVLYTEVLAAEDSESLPDEDEIEACADLLGEYYEEAVEEIRRLQGILDRARIGDIVYFTATVCMGNFLVEASYHSILSEAKYFDIYDYYEDDADIPDEDMRMGQVHFSNLQGKLSDTLKDLLG